MDGSIVFARWRQRAAPAITCLHGHTRLHTQKTDHAARSVTIGRIYLHSRLLRCDRKYKYNLIRYNKMHDMLPRVMQNAKASQSNRRQYFTRTRQRLMKFLTTTLLQIHGRLSRWKKISSHHSATLLARRQPCWLKCPVNRFLKVPVLLGHGNDSVKMFQLFFWRKSEKLL